MDRAKVMLANFLSGTNYRLSAFYIWIVASGHLFRKYDFSSPELNMVNYGQNSPL